MYQQFISDVWSGLDDGFILIWAYNGSDKKYSTWCDSPDAAAKSVDSWNKQKFNVYMCAGLSEKNMGHNLRVLKDQVFAIGGLWLDLDIADPVHSKNNLPATIEEATALLREFPFDPSYIVNSGHGLQAWWLFKEPWYFRSPYERADAAQLEKRLIYFFKSKAQAHGWDVDSVFNLDRVMRVPGTVNYKSAPVPVEVIQRGAVDDADDSDVFRYNPSDFETFLPVMQAYQIVGEENKESAQITLNDNANPPFDKFNLLSETDQKFLDSWNKERKDFTSGDFSLSTYDFSLARIAYAVGWTDQEVCNLLIAFRRKHKGDLKMQNLQYYQRTLARAKAEAARAASMENIESHAQAQSPDAPAVIDPNQKDALLQSLSAVFNVKLIQIKRYIADPPSYVLMTERGTITLGEVDNLIGQSALRSKIAAVAGVYLRKFKSNEWDAVAQTLLNCCLDVPLDDSASEAGAIRELLEMYLDCKPPIDGDGDDANDAIQNQQPLRVKDGIAVFGYDFRKWMRTTQQEKLTGKQMGVLLRSIGARADKIPCTHDNKPTTKSVWIIPD